MLKIVVFGWWEYGRLLSFIFLKKNFFYIFYLDSNEYIIAIMIENVQYI